MDTGPFVIALISSFLLMAAGSLAVSALRSWFKISIKQPGPAWTLAVRLYYLLLFGVMGFSFVPVAVSSFLSMQARIGNGGSALIMWMTAHERQAVYGVWVLFLAGLAVALPSAARSGFFKGQKPGS